MTVDNAHESATTCPYCGYRASHATGLGDSGAPEDGNVSLCIDCGSFSFFQADAPGGLAIPDGAEIREIHADLECARALQAWKMMDAARRAGELPNPEPSRYRPDGSA